MALFSRQKAVRLFLFSCKGNDLAVHVRALLESVDKLDSKSRALGRIVGVLDLTLDPIHEIEKLVLLRAVALKLNVDGLSASGADLKLSAKVPYGCFLKRDLPISFKGKSLS